MSRALALSAGPRLAPRPGRRVAAWRPLLASAAMHGLAMASIVALTLLGWHRLPEPEELPHFDVMLLDGAFGSTGAGVSEASLPAESVPSDPLPPMVPPPTPPLPAPTTSAAPPPAPPAVALTQPPSSPPPQNATTLPLPPPQPAQPLAPPPQPHLPAVEQPPAPAQPMQLASLSPPPAPEAPEVRLGDSLGYEQVDVSESGIYLRAEADKRNIPPLYPLDAARRGEQGTVTLRLTIGTDGGVLTAEVAKSSGSPRLDRAALTRIETWHFKPAMRDGKPQIDVIEFGVEFQLN